MGRCVLLYNISRCIYTLLVLSLGRDHGFIIILFEYGAILSVINLIASVRLHVTAIFQDFGKVYASTKQHNLTKTRQTNYLHS